jgi:hypothetical protein
MSWIFGDIDFADYEVYVSRSSGVLNMPKLQTEGYNWLDEDGRDYWDDPKYSDREIILNCWIVAGKEGATGAYENFKSKVNTFTEAVKDSGKVTFQTPFCNITECSISKGVSVIRETNYVQKYQVGTFSLRINVHGDIDAYELDIKRWTGTETLTMATIYTDNLKVNKTLQGDIYATCSFEVNEKLDLKYFDYIGVTSNGVNEDRFHLATEPQFKKISSNKFQYNLRFEHQSRWLESSQFLNDRSEADFYYFANLDEIVDLIVENHNRSWYDNFRKGTIISTERKNHKFSGENCLSVLKRLCKEYDLEFEFEYIAYAKYAINISEQVANDKVITLEYGKGNGLYELSRESINSDELCTILYAFGSTKNLSPDYRGGIGRLSFDDNPLSNNDGLHTGAGPQERTVFFDDIYPNRSATVTAYQQVLQDDLTDAQKEVCPEGIYKITDSTLEFDLNDYLLGGLTAKIRMKTGNLAGYEFEIQKYDHDYFSMWIIPFKDEQGEIYPNADFYIATGNQYTLVDIGQPTSYIEVAEAELEAAATAYLADHSVPHFPYRVVVDPAYMKTNPGGFEVGDRFDIVDTDYGIDDEFRISQLTYDVYQGRYDFMLSDTVRLNRRQILELRMQAVERAMQSARKDSAESSRNNVEDSGELRRRLLDPADDKFAADRIVRNESIDPRMLAYDSGNIQWSFQGVWFSDKDGDGVSIAWTEGTFVIHNDKAQTLDRYGIDKRRILDVEYDPTRTWNIAAGDWEVPAADYDVYWVYVKLTMAAGSTVAEIEFYKEHKEPKLLPGYLRYKIGGIQRELELEV